MSSVHVCSIIINGQPVYESHLAERRKAFILKKMVDMVSTYLFKLDFETCNLYLSFSSTPGTNQSLCSLTIHLGSNL
jgi:hypothetical protein